MDVPRGFEPVSRSFAGDGTPEYLRWVPPDAPVKLYPGFFRTELNRMGPGVRHFVSDER